MKLTLRELFLLVVIAAMGCGWWVNRWQLSGMIVQRERIVQFLNDELCDLGYLTAYDGRNGVVELEIPINLQEPVATNSFVAREISATRKLYLEQKLEWLRPWPNRIEDDSKVEYESQSDDP